MTISVNVFLSIGTFFAMPCFSLVVQVIGKSVCDDDTSDANFKYHINDGINGSFSFLLSDPISICPSLLKVSIIICISLYHH